MPAVKASGDSRESESHVFDEKTIVVVFGASGDVAKKLAYPALFALFSDGQLPPKIRIFGYARSDLSEEDFHKQLTGGLGDDADQSKIDEFKKLNQYVKGAYDEDAAFQHLEEEIQKVADKEFDSESNRVYYLALPPSQFTALSSKIKKNNYKGLHHRLVIEKPFGKDTDSCREMMKQILNDWQEEEIFRIDHFLGDELVRNITHLRFGNEHLIEPLMRKDHVAAVKVELSEEFGCEGRGGYFDEFGMIRDVLQNHLLQVALLLAMDKPKSLQGDGVRDSKRAVLKSVRPADSDDAVFGQYTRNGDKPGYLEDDSVENKESTTETFATTILWIDNERWQGVPFILKAGKGLDRNLSRVTVQFKQPSSPLFGEQSETATELRIELLPEEKVYFVVHTKEPGLADKQTSTEMTLQYKNAFPNIRIPDAYETVLRAVLQGDQSMFIREDELIASWEVYTPLLHKIESKGSPRPIDYKRGSSGPRESTELEKRVGYVVENDE